ncbi:MAG: pyridoxamine 5'-phosphate oxidase family protein [Desulfovibrio sp.]|nr:pyridoxamine 5'-phosphate oxidase family protein [Desulfovibrio sp.]
MRRIDREVADLQELCRMLDGCDVLHVGLCQHNVPYVVPLSFGWESVDGRLVLWFHCARQGRKTAMLKANPAVSVCASRFVRYDQTAAGVTARYESVMGEGTASEAEDEDSRLHGLELILAHCGYGQVRPAGCRNLGGAAVWKIVLDTVTAKRNLRQPS